MADNIDDGDGVKHPSKLKLFFTIKAETERFSKFFNMVEVFLVYFIIIFFLYRLIFGPKNIWNAIVVDGMFVYTMILGPYLHKNSSVDIGIAHIDRFKHDLTNWKNAEVVLTVILLLVLSVLVFPLFFSEFEVIMRVVPFLGSLNDYVYNHIPLITGPLAVIEYVLFQIILIVLLIRKDNLFDAFKDMAKPMLYLVLIVMGYAFVTVVVSFIATGTATMDGLEGFTLYKFFATWYSYTFSGLLQQIPFLVYFSTRFRKGLPAHRYSEWLNVIFLSFYFGFFHAPQWILVIFAGMMEVVIARSFLHDESRNLFAAAIVHGLLGTLIIFFTNIYIHMDFI